MKELDAETMQRLYAFGGLIAYKVMVFNRARFEVETVRFTFNEDEAVRMCGELIDNDHIATFSQFMVHFDGAFSKS